MKIDLNSLQQNFQIKKVNEAKDSNFDLHLESYSLGISNALNPQHITSLSGCTPGCGYTGTGTSNCCTC